MDKPELKAVPDQPKTLPERIAELKKALETFIANANAQAARLSGKIEAYEEILASQHEEAKPDAV